MPSYATGEQVRSSGVVPADHKGLAQMMLLRVSVFLGVHAGLLLGVVAFF